MRTHRRFPYFALTLPFVVAATWAQQGDSVVAMSAMEAKPIQVGAQIPNAQLTNLDGKTVSLKSVTKGRATVLVFYRGGWCPFCNAHLADLGMVADQVKAKGYQILAISPDRPEELKKTMDKHHMTYTLLSDASAEAMKKFGVAYRLDDETYRTYRDKYSIDLEKSSGKQHHVLPVPSVFVVDKTGKIQFVYSNPDYKVRLKGEELLKNL